MARAVKRIHIQHSVLTMCLAMYEAYRMGILSHS